MAKKTTKARKTMRATKPMGKKLRNAPRREKLNFLVRPSLRSALVFAALFGVVGVVLLIRSFAATTTVNYSGKLTSDQPSYSYSIAAASGALSATVSSNTKGVRVFITDVSGVTLVSQEIANKSATAAVQVTPGTYTVTVSYSGNLKKPVNYRLAITYPIQDTTNPVVIITSPTTTEVSGVQSITADAKDDGGISKVEFYDGSTLLASDSTSPYGFSWDTTKLVNGSTHVLKATAYDTNNNQSSATLSVVINNNADAPPQSTLSCTGVSVTPGQFTQTFVNSYPNGTTFCLKSGTHYIATSILAKSNDIYWGESGTILDFANASLSGQGGFVYCFYGYGGTTGQQYVTVKNLAIRNCAPSSPGAALKLGWNWTVDKVDVSNSYDGVHVSNNAVIRNSYLHHNNQYGLAGGPASNILIENNELAFNDQCYCHPGDDGASKIVGSLQGTVGVTWRGNYVHDNNGIGIWQDGNVKTVLIENNRLVNNSEGGIGHEISWDATIRNNTLTGNAKQRVGKSCWNGADIGINNSQNVEIYGNTLEPYPGANGICTVDNFRPDDTASAYPQSTANIKVYGNTLRLSRTANVEYASQNGAVGRTINNVTFNNNTYYVKSIADTYWAYLNYPLTWSALQSKGQEAGGTVQVW
jgi:parallel beta-helix repeat protein